MEFDTYEPVNTLEQIDSIYPRLTEVINNVDSLADAEGTLEQARKESVHVTIEAYRALHELSSQFRPEPVDTETYKLGPEFLETAKRVYDLFQKALQSVEKWDTDIRLLHEKCTEYTSQVASVTVRATAADKFLLSTLTEQINKMHKELEEKGKAMDEAESKTLQMYRLELEKKDPESRIRARDKILEDYKLISWLVPVDREDDAKVLRLEGEQKGIEALLNDLKRNIDLRRQAITNLSARINDLKSAREKLLPKKEQLNRISQACQKTIESLVQTKDNFTKAHASLAYGKAWVNPTFKIPVVSSYIRTVLETIRLAPPLALFDETERIDFNGILSGICANMGSLPSALFAELESTEFDFGPQEESLGVLLDNVRALVQSRGPATPISQ
ncbi:hypothetical protein BDV37DRAFT_200528 [Aspergillus pseudonomiae]|uniref:Uncharacterized protein n=1 Tax=Aspergillus pseudonomiae TaxID=1506151 RepID=A0A5N7D2Y7_9EURO|nr:uncharacterized protein BDV37DRAFT_200528 [Aspergillus pseudonomiae]KAE8400599.1 hypothetical protein BDV37DRAFT_200528 [Aspergillus pseudonomiae]